MIPKKLQTLQLFFSNLCFRNIYKVVYKLSHSNQYKHNRRFWPYYQVERDTENGLQKLFSNRSWSSIIRKLFVQKTSYA
jgi:hypothetical protein